MSDELTNDDIAQMIEDAYARSYVVKGHKRTVVGTDWLTLVLRQLLAARAERDAAVAAIRKHRDTPGDDRCWQDDDALYAVLPEGHTQRTALDPETMRKNCERYIECRINGLPYQTEQERIDAAVAEERAWCVAIAARELAKGSSAADVVAAIRRGE